MYRDEITEVDLTRFDERTRRELKLLSSKIYGELDANPSIHASHVCFQSPMIETEYQHISDLLPSIRTMKREQKIISDKKEAIEGGLKALVHGGPVKWKEDMPYTLAEMFLNTVKEHPKTHITFYDEEGRKQISTYEEIYENALSILVYFNEQGIKRNDKLILQLSNNRDYVENFWACMFGGIVVVPLDCVHTTDPTSTQAQLLKNIWKLLDKPYILVSENLRDDYVSLFGNLNIGLKKLLFTELTSNTTKKGTTNILEPDELAMIFFTSGSTGMPKGVTQTNGAACMQVIGNNQLLNYEKDVMLNWMPLEHPGGILMAHARAVFVGSEQILVNKEYILGKPLRWLDLIDEHRVVHTWAPHFAYALINEKIKAMKEKPWDLLSVKYFLNGGEMIDAKGAKSFLTSLAVCGLSQSSIVPAWGMAESCSGTIYNLEFTDEMNCGVKTIRKELNTDKVVFTDKGEHAMTITGIGKPIPEFSMRIADAKNQILPEGVIGRVQVQGPSVTKGYYRNDEVNEESYTPDHWFITGDLGFICDGQMYLTGREKDIIIINGLNYNNVEIESIIEALPSVLTSYTAVCAVLDQNSETEKIAVFYVPASEKPYDVVRKEITQIIFEKLQLPIDYVIPVETFEIPKTNLNKIQRAKLAKRFMSGEYDAKIRNIDLTLHNSNTIPSWFYCSKWYETPRSVRQITEEKRYCFFLCQKEDETYFTDIQHSVFVYHGKKFTDGEYESTVNYTNYESILTYFHSMGGINNKFDRIVYVAKHENIGKIKSEGMNWEFQGLVSLSKALANIPGINIQFYVITQGLYGITPYEQGDVALGNMPGFIKCLEEEVGDMTVCHIDVDTLNDCKTRIQLSGELKSVRPYDNVVGIRAGVRYSEYLEKIEFDDMKKSSGAFAPNQLVLVTGGLGGIGYELCKYLLKYYDSKIIITGRTALEEISAGKKSDAFSDMREYSEHVLYFKCDVCEEKKMKQIITEAQERFGQKLDVIIHSAGLGNLSEHWQNVKERWIKNISITEIESMSRAKIQGTLSLYHIAETLKDVSLILFSSTNSFFGSATFAAYSSANSFMDQFARWATTVGNVSTTCLNFSSWKEVGMSENNSFESVSAAKGISEIHKQQGVVSIDYAVRSGRHQVFIGIDGSKDLIRKHFRSGDRYLLDVYAQLKKDSTWENKIISKGEYDIQYHCAERIDFKKDFTVDIHLRENEEIRKGSLIEDYTETEKWLIQIWKELLKLKEITPEEDFYELGGKSLIATQLVERIRENFNISFTLRNVFTHSILSDMAAKIDNEKRIC